MIVLNEQLADPRIIRSIEHWYKGRVIVVEEVRPQTRITDDVIPALLRELKQPTFVTINHEDFWRKIPANSAYCVVCLRLTSNRPEFPLARGNVSTESGSERVMRINLSDKPLATARRTEARPPCRLALIESASNPRQE